MIAAIYARTVQKRTTPSTEFRAISNEAQRSSQPEWCRVIP